jgi:hypothetical protein
VPYNLAPDWPEAWKSYTDEVDRAIAAGDRGAAFEAFLRVTGTAEEDIAGMRSAPFWSDLEAMAHTLRYDAACLGTGPPPIDRLATIRQPVLVLTGDERPPGAARWSWPSTKRETRSRPRSPGRSARHSSGRATSPIRTRSPHGSWGSSVHERSPEPSQLARDPTTWSARRRLHLPVPDRVRMPIMRRCATSRMRDDFADYGTSDLRQSFHGVARRRKGLAMEITNLGAADGLPPVDWAAVIETLDAGSAPAPDAHNTRTTWLSTVNEDGSPHVTAVGALWLDGTFWFQTGAGTRKGRNVARDPRCSIAVSIRDADVVIEGDAARVTDPATVARIAKAWADNGWPAEPDESGSGITAPFNAPSLGPPPWNVYRVDPRSATVALGTEPGGLTRFRF